MVTAKTRVTVAAQAVRRDETFRSLPTNLPRLIRNGSAQDTFVRPATAGAHWGRSF